MLSERVKTEKSGKIRARVVATLPQEETRSRNQKTKLYPSPKASHCGTLVASLPLPQATATMPHSIRVLSCSLSGTSARGGAADTNSSSRPPHHSTCSRSSRTPITTVARGGGNLFGPGGGGGEGRLIMPGQQGGGGGRGGGGASGGRLIIPGEFSSLSFSFPFP